MGDNETYPRWEKIADETFSLKIHGGCLYRHVLLIGMNPMLTESMTFVPGSSTGSEALNPSGDAVYEAMNDPATTAMNPEELKAFLLLAKAEDDFNRPVPQKTNEA